MKNKELGTLLGVVAVVLWFMPWGYVHIQFMGGIDMIQSGSHIGGGAYLILLGSFAYSVLSWMELHFPRLIASSLSLLLSMVFLFGFGINVAWGLIALTLSVGISAYLAFKDYKAQG